MKADRNVNRRVKYKAPEIKYKKYISTYVIYVCFNAFIYTYIYVYILKYKFKFIYINKVLHLGAYSYGNHDSVTIEDGRSF